MIGLRTLCSALLTAGALSLAPPAAQADVAIDVAPGGAAYLGWSGSWSPGVRARPLAADGTMGGETTYNPGAGSDVFGTALDDAGTATILFESGGGLKTRRRSPGGSLGPERVLTTAPVRYAEDRPRMALDHRGGAVFVWVTTVDGREIVQGRRQRPDGTLTPVVSFTNGAYTLAAPQVAVDARGVATVAFLRKGPSAVQSRRWDQDGTLRALQTVSPSGDDVQDVRLGVAPGGRAVIGWSRHQNAYPGSYAYYSAASYHARVRRADGSLGPVVRVSPASEVGARGAFDLAVEDDGDAVLAWASLAEDGKGVLRLRRMAADGGLTAPQTLSQPASATSFAPRVKVDGQGNAVLVWHRYTGWREDSPVETRRRRADGTLGSVATLFVTSDSDEFKRLTGFDFDVSDAGVATFAFVGGYPERVFTRRRDPGGTLGPRTYADDAPE